MHLMTLERTMFAAKHQTRTPLLRSRHAARRGAATLDYVLLLGVILPLMAFVVPTGKKIIQLAYEMTCTLIAWPFL